VSLELIVDVILLIALWPLSRLSLLQKRQKGLFPGVRYCRCVRLTTWTPSWAFVIQCDNLNFVETSGNLGPVMRLIYLFNPLKCRSPALLLLCSLVRILFGHGYSSLVGVVFSHVDVWKKLIARLEDSYWVGMCV